MSTAAKEPKVRAGDGEEEEEFELKAPSDEYEVMPVAPLRRLEKRLEFLEQAKTSTNLEKFVDKVLDMVELNQKIVEEVIRSNVSLREDIAVLVGKMDELYSRLGDFIDVIKAAGEEEGAEVVSKKIVEASITPLVSKIEESNKKLQESNAAIADALSAIERRLRATAIAARPAAPASTGILRRAAPEEGVTA